MNVQFRIRYRTTYGEQLLVCGDHPALGNFDIDKALPLNYYNTQEWRLDLDLDLESGQKLVYYYFLKNENNGVVLQEWKKRQVLISRSNQEAISLLDVWSDPGLIDYAFDTEPFEVLAPSTPREKLDGEQDYNLIFEIFAPLINDNQVLCLLGSCEELRYWDTSNPVLLKHIGKNRWQAHLKVKALNGRLEYKYGLYDKQQKNFVGYEQGENRVVEFDELPVGHVLKVTDEKFGRPMDGAWRGTGVAVPVFSIRTQNGMGVGEFSDLKLLADWSVEAGMQMIQILPINDTTATMSWEDSYPYAAISVFALHPLYLNVDQLPHADEVEIQSYIQEKKKQLNASSSVDYERVVLTKWEIIEHIFSKYAEELMEDEAFHQYVDEHKCWLVPYAAFCYLRERYQTADFSKWGDFATFDASKVRELTHPDQSYYKDIAIHYYVQYELHRQLKDAVDYIHDKGLVLKGDLPIGIFRHSVDAWVAPDLYHMNMQAGAPPDDFSRKGQNWGFPTYNWDKMAEDNYSWWKNRFSHLSIYFDLFRIDHILGFFRIWQVPMGAVEGLMGFFDPALPIHRAEFSSRGIYFDYDRFCKPLINDKILESTFGEQTAEVKSTFLELKPDTAGLYQFKASFDTQKKVEAYFRKLNPSEAQIELRDKLYELQSNFLFIEEPGSEAALFHPRSLFKYTSSFQWMPPDQQNKLQELYNDYFYSRQEEFWRVHGMKKLPAMKAATNMLICGEDLGMVPKVVPEVMEELGILSLEVQRMPKKLGATFFHPKNAPYLSVVTPSSHDTSTIRGWWEEDRQLIQQFYNQMLGHTGPAPTTCTTEIVTGVIRQHLHSPAMWAVFPIQDFLGMNEELRHPDVDAERINIPAVVPHYWKYRMHIDLETLVQEEAFNKQLKQYVWYSGR